MRLSEDKKTLIKVSSSDIQNGLFTIPNSVTRINKMAFADCTGLTSLIIPNSVTHIDDWAFRGCTGLTSLIIPGSVTHIGFGVFRGCTDLTSLIIANSVTYISFFAFAGCTGLTSLDIPNSVTDIGDMAFAGCTGLTSLDIPNSVTDIGDMAFAGCTGLTSLSITSSVTDIGHRAFYNCDKLSVILIDAPNKTEYQRILDLFPQEQQHLLLPFDFCQDIKQAKYQALKDSGVIPSLPFKYEFPEGLINRILQSDDFLRAAMDKIPLPQQLGELEQYKKNLDLALSKFIRGDQRILAIDKLKQVITDTKDAIESERRIGGFFKQGLVESLSQIDVAHKLIQWLSGDTRVTFTNEEKDLIENKKSSVGLILKNHGINPNDLPEAPNQISGLKK